MFIYRMTHIYDIVLV